MLKEVMLEITNACNSECLMCMHSLSKRPITHMPLELIEKVVSECKRKQYANKDYPLGICGIGEPILHPQFKEALDIIKQVPFGLGSNCQALTREKADMIIDAQFSDFTLSLDAVKEETHSLIRKGLNFWDVMQNALYFIEKLKKKPVFWRNVFIQMIVNKLNINEMYEFKEKWLEIIDGLKNVKVFFKPMCKWPGHNNPIYPSPKIKVEENNEHLLYGPFHVDMVFRENCNLFNNFVQILSDGTYSPCCMNTEDEYKIGNIKDHTIEELYYSPKMERYRELFKNKRYDEIPFCSKCI